MNGALFPSAQMGCWKRWPTRPIALESSRQLHQSGCFVTPHPWADAEVDYGDRSEHCWNGDHARANAYSRLRYHQMFIPRIMDQIRQNHPPGADTVSWRY